MLVSARRTRGKHQTNDGTYSELREVEMPHKISIGGIVSTLQAVF
jgi:hypothetical protein